MTSPTPGISLLEQPPPAYCLFHIFLSVPPNSSDAGGNEKKIGHHTPIIYFFDLKIGGGGVQFFKVMFCRVRGFRVRVWELYRTCRSFGYGYGSVTELTAVPGIVARAYRNHRSSRYCGTGAQNSQKFRAGTKNAVPVPGYCGTGRTELTEVPGTGMNVLHNSQKFRVRV